MVRLSSSNSQQQPKQRSQSFQYTTTRETSSNPSPRSPPISSSLSLQSQQSMTSPTTTTKPKKKLGASMFRSATPARRSISRTFTPPSPRTVSRNNSPPSLSTIYSPIVPQTPRNVQRPKLVNPIRSMPNPTTARPTIPRPMLSPRSVVPKPTKLARNHSVHSCYTSSDNDCEEQDYDIEKKRRRSVSPIYGRKSFFYDFDRMLPLMQIFIVIAIIVVIVESHFRANNAAKTLLHFKEEESLLLLKLQKVERHSLQLHETISKRLRRAGIINEDGSNSSGSDSGEEDSNNEPTLQQHPLTAQTTELKSMTQQLNKQTEELQWHLQDTAVQKIIEEYGEGPVKVVLEIDFPEEILSNKKGSPSSSSYTPNASKQRNSNFDSSNHLSIVLWPDTPHAGWTWLEQIGRHVWDGTVLNWSIDTPVLEMTPPRPDPLGRGHLDFIESEHNADTVHGAWTVGLREHTETGQLQMFLNMQDNGEYHQHEVCVGKLLDGFEALQRIVEATRLEGHDVSTIRIKKAHAVHVTKRELGLENIWQ